MLVSLSDILKDAEAKKYGVGLFNQLNLDMARGIIEAAEEERSPLILGIAEVHLPVIPFEYAAHIMLKMAKEASVPVCLHFDHGTDFKTIMMAIKWGFTSVMFDGSSLSYAENVAQTRSIANVAHALGVNIEAELGRVGGNEGGGGSMEEEYTNVNQVDDFIKKTQVDALAIAIGTAHGNYIRKPVLDINRLAEIYEVSKGLNVPLVLHGGSGLSENDFKKSIQNGIRKVNICTEMCNVAHEAYKKVDKYELAVMVAKESVKEVVKKKMRLFGSNNKA